MTGRWISGAEAASIRAWALVRRLVLGAVSAARGLSLRPSTPAGSEPEMDAGMSTAEYAVGTIAAVAFAAVLYKVVSSTTVVQALTGLISRALSAPF